MTFSNANGAMPPLPPKSLICKQHDLSLKAFDLTTRLDKFRSTFLEKRRIGLAYFLKCVKYRKFSKCWLTIPKLCASQPRLVFCTGNEGVHLQLMSVMVDRKRWHPLDSVIVIKEVVRAGLMLDSLYIFGFIGFSTDQHTSGQSVFPRYMLHTNSN